ncbi:MAG: DNA mismatch repair endonuclease MutL [Candidatus Aminicenantes bacterium]|nr:DNA mismatch repair endonuclease MutL [Candidatus Aminicenantes bacterium]
MNRISVLPPGLAQKIAAGEVIERPVSVVKELVENALDAGATEVAVDLVGGGKRLARVRDNGSGMSRRDAELAFIRHATSKIADEGDLFAIATLGFRGEALASIAAVSRVTLRTSEGGSASGTQVEREGEAVREVREIAFPGGTEVEVRDLFFNLPARAKFLRGDAAELGLIVKFLVEVSLARPGLRITAREGSRTVLNGLPVAGLRERIHQVFGRSAVDKLIEVDHVEGERAVRGLASRPPEGGSARPRQVFFVNGRPVRDKVLSASLRQAYRGFLERDLGPEAYLFVTLPFDEVDVNVHPAKSEIRFRDSQAVFQLMLRGLEKARLRASGVKDLAALMSEAPPSVVSGPDPSPAGGRTAVLDFGVSEKGEAFSAESWSGGPAGSAGGPRLIGQFADAYILAETADDLLVIDQHNAHERILFDRYAEVDRLSRWPVKMSLLPLVFELSPSQRIGLEARRKALEKAGFRVEAMGGASFALREYPDVFKPEEALGVVLDMIGEEKRASVPEGERLLCTMACRSAVKAGEPLPREKMAFLLRELFRSANPALCPHGRPIVLRLAKRRIERGLGRPAGSLSA